MKKTIIPIGLFVRGEAYELLGFIPMDRHLIGPVESGQPFYLIGGDANGRDVLSRTIYSSRISLTIAWVGVAISMTIGIVLGGLSGLIGGVVDNMIQTPY